MQFLLDCVTPGRIIFILVVCPLQPMQIKAIHLLYFWILLTRVASQGEFYGRGAKLLPVFAFLLHYCLVIFSCLSP